MPERFVDEEDELLDLQKVKNNSDYIFALKNIPNDRRGSKTGKSLHEAPGRDKAGIP